MEKKLKYKFGERVRVWGLNNDFKIVEVDSKSPTKWRYKVSGKTEPAIWVAEEDLELYLEDLEDHDCRGESCKVCIEIRPEYAI